MSSSTVHLASPVCMALGHVFQGGPLPFKNGIKDEEAGDIGEGLTVLELIKCLRKILEGSKDVKVYESLRNFWQICIFYPSKLNQVREHCAIALGRMGVTEQDSSHKHALLDSLFSVREEKAVELQFTVGEALSCVAAGPLSTALVNPWRVPLKESW